MNATYDPWLVGLSIAVAIFASYVALDLASRVTASHGTRAGRMWLLGGAVSMGTGVWSMHFIGMLAHKLPIAVAYDIPVTMASLVIAIVVSGFALFVVSNASLGVARLLGGGVLMGLGISAMHYSGMEAMQLLPALTYGTPILAASVAIAVGASIAALWIAFNLRSRGTASVVWKRAGSAVVMGAAIAGMHYTGMGAAIFAPDAVCIVSPQDVSNVWLACVIAGFTFLLLVSTLLLSIFDARLEDRSAKLAEKLRRVNEDLVVRSDELASNCRQLEHEMGERALAEQALRESEERYRVLVELSSDWTWEQDTELRFIAAAGDKSSITDKVGKRRWELPDTEPLNSTWTEHRALLDAREAFHELLIKRTRAGGSPQYVSVSGKPIFDAKGVFRGYRGVASDVTLNKEAEERLAYLAQYDSLTGLPNRTLFRDRLAQAMCRAKRDGRMVGLMFIDLDHFKEINDTLGHAVGDEVLKAAAQRLKGALRGSDTVARLGGDEFTVILEDISDAAQVSVVAETIQAAFTTPLLKHGRDIFASASIGVTVYPRDDQDLEGLLKAADVAMYHAKQEGRARHEVYVPELNAQAAGQLQMEGLLRRALERDELSLHYQPKLDMAGGRINGMEALLRWNSPEMGAVSPAQFIPLAEKSGSIVPIGEWVLETACAQAMAWREQGFGDLTISVNLSPRQFREKDLVDVIAATLARTRLEPRLLELEITEGMIMTHPDDAIALLQQLHRLGVRLSIDDFGTGYSSLAYLKRFPVQTIKIDRSFVAEVANNPDDAAIVTAIIAMAKSLRLRVVAEGVETREQLDFLQARGCHEFQGYYFSRPLPPAQLGDLLRKTGAAALHAERQLAAA